MKNRDLLELNSFLQGFANVKSTRNFAYAIFKNLDILAKEVEIINKTIQKEPPQDYMIYENERNLVCVNNSKKDEYGQAIILEDKDQFGNVIRKKYDIENFSQFESDMTQLNEKYKESLEEVNNLNKDIENFLNAENNITLEKITKDDLPEEISPNDIKNFGAIMS